MPKIIFLENNQKIAETELLNKKIQCSALIYSEKHDVASPNRKFWEIFVGDIFGRYLRDIISYTHLKWEILGDIFGENGRYWEIFF